MADFEDDSIKIALGSKFVKKIDKSFEKLAKQNSKFVESFDDIKRDVRNLEQKLPQLTAIKKASEAGGNALTSQQAYGLMNSIRANVIDQTNKVKTQVMSLFAPLDVEIKQTIDLLTSNSEVNQDKALDRIEKLRKGMNVDFEKVAEAMGANVRELIAQRQFMKENNREQEEIENNKKENNLKIRDELRERGINTFLDKQTNTLKVMTLKDEKAFKKQIISDEKRLAQLEKEYISETKVLQKQKTISDTEQKQSDNKRLLILDLQKDIDKKKEEANIKPEVKSLGFFGQSFGQAADLLKNTFGEIGQMGKGLGKAFKDLPNTAMSFGKSLGKAALGLIVFALKSMLVVAAIVLFIYVVYKIVSTIMKAVDWIKSKLSWIFGDDKKEEADMKSGEGKYQSMSETPNESADMESSSFGRDVKQESVSNESNIYNTDRSNKNQISNSSETMVPGLTPITPTRIQSIPRRQENVNQMSTELAATKSQGMNQVIAPTSMNNVTTNSTTQAVSSTPQNLDRSFINLNTVPV
jgi:hypothetical protein